MVVKIHLPPWDDGNEGFIEVVEKKIIKFIETDSTGFWFVMQTRKRVVFLNPSTIL